MSEAPVDDSSATNGAGRRNGSSGEDGDDSGGTSLTDVLPTERLKEAAQTLLKAATERAVSAALDQVEGLSGRLGDVAENGGVGLTQAFRGGGGDGDDGDGGGSGGGIGGAIKSGLSSVKDTVTGALGIGGGDDDGDGEGGGSGGGGGGGSAGARGKFKFMNIYEVQDVGVPLRVAYDQWTQFADFPSFMKKVETVEQAEDEKVNWTAKVFWSRRQWQTTIVEQVPDSHILWVSTGAKGRADGFVSFGEISPNTTKIILILEYYPQGFFEKTGNIWRAVGRRARLEFKHFCRHVMMDTLVNRDDLEGWRGEIRDSEVVKTHEEALEEERAANEADEYSDEDTEGEYGDDEYDADEYDADVDDEGDEDLDDDPEGEEFVAADEADTDDAELDDEYDDEDELEDELEDEEPEDADDEPERPTRGRRARRTQPA